MKVRCSGGGGGGGGRADRCPSLLSLAVGRAEERSYEPVSEGWESNDQGDSRKDQSVSE